MASWITYPMKAGLDKRGEVDAIYLSLERPSEQFTVVQL